MIEPAAFALAALALLATPGPTNALIATSAASAGAVRSAPLVLAAVFGRLVSTLAVALALTPFAAASDAIELGLRLACGAFLAFAAWRLWTDARAVNDDAPIRLHHVLAAATLNPRSVVLATVIVPHLVPLRLAAATPYLAELALIAAFAASVWLMLGATLRRGVLLDARLARRTGAIVMAFFAVVVAGSAFMA